MVTGPSEDQTLRAEVVEVAAALRATLEWYGMTGADGIPSDASAPWAPGPVWPEPSVVSPRSEGARAAQPVRAGDRAGSAQPSRPAPRPGHGQPGQGTRLSATEQRAEQPPPRAPSSAVGLQGRAGEPLRASSAAAAPQGQAGEPSTVLQRGPLLEQIAAEVRGCTACALHQTRTQTVFSRGTGSSGLCFVGEGPGADEDAQGEPFVGPAGQLLDRMIAAMGLSRDEVYVCNIVKCRPPGNRKPNTEEMATCVPFLHRQLELLSPTVIVALGGTAVEGLLGITVGITRLRGSWKLYNGRIAVMPTFHPAYLLRSPGAKKEVWEDLQAVLRQMGRSLPPRK